MPNSAGPSSNAAANRTIAGRVATFPEPRTHAELYIDLMKKVLTRAIVAKPFERHHISTSVPWKRRLFGFVDDLLRPFHLELVRLIPTGPENYTESGHMAMNRPEDAETMLGLRQLDQMQAAVLDVLQNNVRGDLAEAGVWRGGMTIFMRALLKAYGDEFRQLWVVDSFEGLPVPDTTNVYAWNEGDMAVSLEEVKGNFARYNLLDERVTFLKGFFNRSLPSAPISEISILRIDADLYESTLDVLNNLYPRLSPGGYAIFDDFYNLQDCRRAIEEYREEHGIFEEIVKIDNRAIYWKKLPRS